jgi:hypothetical protein
VSIVYILCSFTLVHLHWFIVPFHYSIGFFKRLISINSLCTSSIFNHHSYIIQVKSHRFILLI